MKTVIIKKEQINSAAAQILLDELSDELAGITGSSGREQFDYADIDNPRALFVVARAGQIDLACGALRERSNDTAEIKRLYAREKSRGIGGSILHYLEEAAVEYGYSRIVLETRICNTRAVAFYLKNGYKIIENYGKYIGVQEAVCFEKIL